jgi:hypothetical protein
MRRREFVVAALATSALSTSVWAQTTTAAPPEAPATAEPQAIQPTTPLEQAFVMALTEPRMRPVFRQYLVDSNIVLALAGEGANAAPLEIDVRPDFRGAAIFTTVARLESVRADAPHIVLNGRAALERLRGKNVVINPGLSPMLTLDPSDVERYLSREGSSSAGPTQ